MNTKLLAFFTATLPFAAFGQISYNVDIGDFTSETTKGFKRLTLPITVHSNGTISLPSGRKIEPSYTSYH